MNLHNGAQYNASSGDGVGMLESLNSAVVTLTGGTGSFGTIMASHLLKEDVSEIRIFSRDENKQDAMRNKFRDERLKFFIGDVRDSKSVENAISGSTYIFHAAALKQVPSCEFFPMQAHATNVVGSSNVIESAVRNEVKGIVCLSSDKAVYPINTMGMTKALMEKVAQSVARNHPHSQTKIAITRYGNVMMSRGSVIPLFIDQIKSKTPITLTNPAMTRFMMSLSDSVNLVKYAFTNATTGDLFVRKAPACTIETLAKALLKIFDAEGKIDIQIIGTRHGEKLYESLLSTEERARSTDCGDYFKVSLDTRTLDYRGYFEKGNTISTELEAYTSHNTDQLSVDEVAKLVSRLPEFIELARI
jgi:UDP-N-acetylglucosamine 4,6-dehydratase